MDKKKRSGVLVLTLCMVIAIIATENAQCQTTAPDIVVTDCDGAAHDLYEKLDEGKIIVIGWTMPCATCAFGLLDVHNAVLNFAISHPNTVEYWVADDYANTSCSSLKEWCQNKGITNAFYFSSADINMMDFGSFGMPKVVVVGCNSGSVYYNVDNIPDGTGATEGINDALTDLSGGCVPADTTDTANAVRVVNSLPALKVFPNPAHTNISVVLANEAYNPDAVVTISNTIAQGVVRKRMSELDHDGNNLVIDISALEEGLYLISIPHNGGEFQSSFLKL